MEKKLISAEISGGGFVALCSIFMRRLYTLNGGELIGILFGAVNNSPWETAKTLLLPYLVWALLELMAVKPRVCRFTAAKTAGLYLLGAVYLSLSLLLPEPLAAAVGVCAAFMLPLWLYRTALPLQRLFALSVCLLFLFVALYFSLTPFAPHLALFRDAETGMYGIPTV